MSDILISDKVRDIFQWIFYVALCQLLDIFGTVANIINVTCFVKQGFKDPVNVSLLGLAISDLGCLVTLIWANICFTPAFNELDLPFEPIEVQYLTGSWPHAIFTRVSSWITASIALERCLCVTIPLKVKTMITPKRVALINAIIFLALLASVSPIYYVNKLVMKFSSTRNKTIFGLIFTEQRQEVEKFTLPINNVIIPFGAFLVVIVCTMALVVNLKIQSKWRTNSTGNGATTRDQRLTKMIVVVSTFFIASNIPLCIIIIALIAVPDLSVDGKYVNTVIVFCSFGFILDSANSSMNIFIYYHMSSRYRAVCRKIILNKITDNISDDAGVRGYTDGYIRRANIKTELLD